MRYEIQDSKELGNGEHVAYALQSCFSHSDLSSLIIRSCFLGHHDYASWIEGAGLKKETVQQMMKLFS
jgi:hypothetical protein